MILAIAIGLYHAFFIAGPGEKAVAIFAYCTATAFFVFGSYGAKKIRTYTDRKAAAVKDLYFRHHAERDDIDLENIQPTVPGDTVTRTTIDGPPSQNPQPPTGKT